MELSIETRNTIRTAYDWFCAGGELTPEAESILSSYLNAISAMATEPEIMTLVSECHDFWTGYCATDTELYPRLGQYRMNGMFQRLNKMAVQAGLTIFKGRPDPDMLQAAAETHCSKCGAKLPTEQLESVIPAPENLPEEASSPKSRLLET